MEELTMENLNKILEEHKHWINKDCKNWEKMRADLRGVNLGGTYLLYAVLSGVNLYNADLRGADLRKAVLSGVNLYNANLRGADLRKAVLSGVNLHNADLRSVDLRGADLRKADLSDAFLRGADLRKADLSDADLSDTDLRKADLRGTDLRGADLRKAVLSDANLRNADLSGADLRSAYLLNANLGGAKNVPYIPMVCPEEGDFIGWKKAESNKNKVIVKLHIPFDAKRSSATTRKCRCSKAEVIAIYNLDGTEAGGTTCHSDYDNSFIYEVGKTVEVTDFNEDRWNECAKGIHFFINRQEAIDY